MFAHTRASSAGLFAGARAELMRLSCSALTMLPALPVSLLPDFFRAVARPEILGQGVLDLSAARARISPGIPGAAAARSRAIVHVAFMSVRCPDGHRCEPSLVRENLRQRHRAFPANHRLMPGSETIACGEARVRRCALRFLAPLFAHDDWPRPPLPQGGPLNQERSCSYEERNVGQCLAARGVPHRHR